MSYQVTLNEITANMDKQSKRCVDVIWEIGSSDW